MNAADPKPARARAEVPSLRTRRYQMFLIVLVVLVVLGVGAMLLNVDATLAGVVLGAISAFGLSVITAGNWHDLRVRERVARADDVHGA